MNIQVSQVQFWSAVVFVMATMFGAELPFFVLLGKDIEEIYEELDDIENDQEEIWKELNKISDGQATQISSQATQIAGQEGILSEISALRNDLGVRRAARDRVQTETRDDSPESRSSEQESPGLIVFSFVSPVELTEVQLELASAVGAQALVESARSDLAKAVWESGGKILQEQLFEEYWKSDVVTGKMQSDFISAANEIGVPLSEVYVVLAATSRNAFAAREQ